MRDIAPLAAIIVFMLCFAKGVGLGTSIGAALFAGIVVLLFTSKHH